MEKVRLREGGQVGVREKSEEEGKWSERRGQKKVTLWLLCAKDWSLDINFQCILLSEA